MEFTAKKPPLISLIIITYNSAHYIVETLNSIKNQTYKNIELLITDDFSTDQTLAICSRWIAENQQWFITVKLLTAQKNTGIAANCNRGLKVAMGDWYKILAGDDIFLPDAMEKMAAHIIAHPKQQILVAQMQPFFDVNGSQINVGPILPDFDATLFFNDFGNTYYQFNKLLKLDYGLPAPCVFIRADVIKAAGGFDENYRRIEDLPMWLKLSSLGYYFYPVKILAVYYRRHEEAVSKIKEGMIMPSYIKELNNIYQNEYIPKAPLYLKIDFYILIGISKTVLALGNKGKLAKFVHGLADLRRGAFVVFLAKKILAVK